MPPVIQVQSTPSQTYFSYYIKNNSSLRSLIFKFTDVSGASVQKALSAGATTTICALENSISVDETEIVSLKKAKRNTFGDISDEIEKIDYSLSKLESCKTIDIGPGAPRQLSLDTLPPKGKPLVASIGGTRVIRDESAALVNKSSAIDDGRALVNKSSAIDDGRAIVNRASAIDDGRALVNKS
jgi:hypothetical protein